MPKRLEIRETLTTYNVDCNRSPIPNQSRKRQQEIRNQTMETYQKYLIEVYQGRCGVVNGIPNSEIRRVANYENRRQLPSVSPQSRRISTCYYYALLLFFLFDCNSFFSRGFSRFLFLFFFFFESASNTLLSFALLSKLHTKRKFCCQKANFHCSWRVIVGCFSRFPLLNVYASENTPQAMPCPKLKRFAGGFSLPINKKCARMA